MEMGLERWGLEAGGWGMPRAQPEQGTREVSNRRWWWGWSRRMDWRERKGLEPRGAVRRKWGVGDVC